MTVPEATNRLLHEIKKSLPYWEELIQSTDFDENELISEFMLRKDDEVREAIYNLVKSIRDEQKSGT